MQIEKVLIVDDEIDICRIIKEYLPSSFRVQFAHDGLSGLKLASEFHPNLILLDINMPFKNGFAVCKELREHTITSDTKIIVMSAYGNLDTKLLMYETGADDFVSKPFELDELRAKVNRYFTSKKRGRLSLGNLTYDFLRFDFRINGEAVSITNSESKILQLLIENLDHLTRKEDFFNFIWTDVNIDPGILSVYIHSLRKKLSSFDYEIKTVGRKGYTLSKRTEN